MNILNEHFMLFKGIFQRNFSTQLRIIFFDELINNEMQLFNITYFGTFISHYIHIS